MPGLLELLLPSAGYLALLLRVVVGGSLVIHGYPKLKEIQGPAKYAQMLGAPAGAAYLVAILEFFGGLLLIVGLIVPVVGFLLALQFAGITLAKKLKLKGAYISGENPVKYEIDVAYLLLAITLTVLGAGAFSVDGALGL